MASIEKRVTPKGTVAYDVRWRDVAGKQRQKSFRRKAEAEQHRARVLTDIASGDYIDPRRARGETVGKWADRWLDTKAGCASVARYAAIVENYVAPRWGSTTLAKVSHEAVADWLADLGNGVGVTESTRHSNGDSAGLSPSSLRKIRGVMSGVFALAIKANATRANPVDGVPLPAPRRAEMRFLSLAEVERLAEAIEAAPRGARPDLSALVLTAALTGLRRSELLRLRCSDVDLDARRVRVRKSKTAAGVRTVPLAARLIDPLREQIERVGGGSALVFSKPGDPDAPLGWILYKRHFIPAVERAGLAPLRFHDLRHTFCALMIAADAKPLALRRYMGHSSITVTLDVYGHLFEEEDHATLDRFDSLS